MTLLKEWVTGMSSGSAAPNGAPSGLTLTVISDTEIQLDWTGGSTNEDGFSIERSTDGVTYSEIATTLTGVVHYHNTGLTVGTLYYYKVRAYKGTLYSTYCTAVSVSTTISLLLTSTGTGAGVSTLTMTVSANTIITLGANATFYTNAGGTVGASQTWTITTGAARTIYLKCTTGTATFVIEKNKITSWSEWTSGVNAASIGGDISKLTSLTALVVRGSNTLSGSLAALTSLTYLVVVGTNTLSGSVAALTSLTLIDVYGSNTLSGSVAALTSLTLLSVRGSNTLSGDLNPVVSDLTYCYLSPCAMVDYTAGATWGNTEVTINPAATYGYSSTEIDNILIDMAASVALISKTITLQGSSAARTVASDAAVATLTGVGRTCTVVTN